MATRDWTVLLLLGSKGMIALYFQPKTCTHKILQGYMEFDDLLATCVKEIQPHPFILILLMLKIDR